MPADAPFDQRLLRSTAAVRTARRKGQQQMTRGSPFCGWSQNASRRPARRTPKSSSHVRFQGKADMARRMDAIISAAFDPKRS
jgi:hypothetical protein